MVLRQGGQIIEEHAEQEKDGPRCTSNFFPRRLCFQRLSARDEGRKKDRGSYKVFRNAIVEIRLWKHCQVFLFKDVGHIERIMCPSLESENTYADTTKELYRPRPAKTTEIIRRGKCFPTFFP